MSQFYDKKILLIEDTREHILVACSILSSFTVDIVENFSDAVSKLNNIKYDLILLDLNLGKRSGLEILSDKKLIKDAGIIICSEQVDISSKIASFSMGASDYICKPFDPVELKLRVESYFMKTIKRKNILEFDGITLNMDTLSVHICEGDQKKSVDFTTLEFRILRYFIENKNNVLSREQILDFIWGTDHFASDRIVDTHISKIRKKLLHKKNLLSSVYGGGYCLKSPTKKAA